MESSEGETWQEFSCEALEGNHLQLLDLLLDGAILSDPILGNSTRGILEAFIAVISILLVKNSVVYSCQHRKKMSGDFKTAFQGQGYYFYPPLQKLGSFNRHL
jgi:hypothetical protein